MTAIRPALLSVKDTTVRGGFGVTKLYALIASGDLIAVKLGAKTLITADSLDQFIANLPRAGIRAKAPARAEQRAA